MNVCFPRVFGPLVVLSICFALSCGGGSHSTTTERVQNSAPVVQSISPSTAAAGSDGFTLTVSGTNFGPSTAVTWDGSAKSTTFVSPTQLTVAVTASDLSASGTAIITAANLAPGGGQASASFTITQPNPPSVSGITPTSAAVGGSAFTLSVTGNNFIASSTIQWNGSNRATTYVNNKQLTASISASDVASAGTALVSVSTPEPGGGQSVPMQFTVEYPLPSIASLSPSRVAIGGGPFTLTVNGSNFAPGALVYWNGISRTTTVVDSTTLKAAVLDADTAVSQVTTVPITVANPAPSAGISNIASFTLVHPAPQIAAIAPTNAIAGTRFTMTVTGSGLMPGAVIHIGGQAFQTTYVNATTITASATASNLGSQSVTVTNPDPSMGPSNGLAFSAGAAGAGIQPTVASLDPSGTVSRAPARLSPNGRYVAFDNCLRDTCLNAPTGCVPSTIRYGFSVYREYEFVAFPSSTGRYVASQRWGGGGNWWKSYELQFSDTCLNSPLGCTVNTKTLVSTVQRVDAQSPRGITMTSDGRYISYAYRSSDYTGPGVSGYGYVYDTCTGAAPGCVPTSISAGGNPTLSDPVISDQARYAVFDQAGLTAQVVLHDSCIGAAPGCIPSDTVISDTSVDCRDSSIGGDAQYAVYRCGANIYLHRTCAGVSSCEKTVIQVSSLRSDGRALVSEGGRFVMFMATDPTLDSLRRIYGFDSCNGVVGACVPRTTLLCMNADGAVANADCQLNGMSTDGSYILFYSGADNLSPGVAGASYIVPNPLK